jgi:uncharacterized membrane-anchored protein
VQKSFIKKRSIDIMDTIEIFHNFVATIVIFGAVTFIYLSFIIAHPYSKKARDSITPYLNGCMAEALVWFALTVVAIVLTNQNALLASVFLQVVGTNVLSVSIIALSFIIVPITFSIHNACSRIDYRPWAIGGFVAIAFFAGIIYLMMQ